MSIENPTVADLLSDLVERLDRAEITLTEKVERLELTKFVQRLDEMVALARETRDAVSLPIRLDAWTFIQEHERSMKETVELVAKDRLSLTRFGDGEFKLAFRRDYNNRFQRGSAALSEELCDILRNANSDPRLMVALPLASWGNSYWQSFWTEYWPVIKASIPQSATYGCAMVSREDFFKDYQQEAIDAWRSVWSRRNVCVLTGRGSRFRPIEALFSNAASIECLFSVPEHAFEDLPRLTTEVAARVSTDTLCLIALGPAGTVLARRLHRMGYQAIDVGHINRCYETVFQGAPKPEALPTIINQN